MSVNDDKGPKWPDWRTRGPVGESPKRSTTPTQTALDSRQFQSGVCKTRVPSPEGNEQIGGEKEQSAYRRATPRSSATSSNYPGHKDVEGNS
uniref:Uncharacterized protein n=1 Tax=Solanum tuberosum TaxID=4113 RepID=M1DEW6_SOLTU